MAHCWEEYMWKVHKAMPIDPWTTQVQLLDVFILEGGGGALSHLWFGHKPTVRLAALSRAGPMLSLGSKDSCKPKAVPNASVPVQQSDSNVDGDATLNVQPMDINKSSGATHDGQSNIDGTNSDTAHNASQPHPGDSINASRSPQVLKKADSNATSKSLLPSVGNANSDGKRPLQLNKSRSINQLLKENTSKHDGAVPAHVANEVADKEMPAQSQNIHKSSDNNLEANYKTLSIKVSRMPDIQASIRSSTSLLISLTGGPASSSAQFDAKGSKFVTCNVNGVESQHVDLDALMELVIRAHWRPDASLPQLQWSPKRGQTLWVVTEIMYANLIMIEADNQAQATSKAKVSKGVGVEVSDQVGVEKDGVWRVTAPKDNPIFPFAVRLQKLKYDGCGSLVTSNKNLTRNISFTNKLIRSLSSKHVVALYRSSSVSRSLS